MSYFDRFPIRKTAVELKQTSEANPSKESIQLLRKVASQLDENVATLTARATERKPIARPVEVLSPATAAMQVRQSDWDNFTTQASRLNLIKSEDVVFSGAVSSMEHARGGIVNSQLHKARSRRSISI